MSRLREKHRSKRPRVNIDFDDNRKGVILIKRIRRDSKGRLVEDILPRHPIDGSASESSSSESDMGKHKRPRRDRDRPEERKRRKERDRDRRTRNDANERNRLDRYFSRVPETQHQGPSHRDDRRNTQRPFKSHRRPADPEEEAPPAQYHDSAEASGERVRNTRASRQTNSCGTGITPGRFLEPARTADANSLPANINLTLNVCGVPSAPTIVERTSGITIQCNHPQSNLGCANATTVPSGAFDPTREQATRRDSPPARSGVRSVCPQKDAYAKKSTHKEVAVAEPSRQSPNATPSTLAPIPSPRSIHREDRELFREKNIWARLDAIKRDLSQSHSAPQTPSVKQNTSPTIAIPEGPPREPFSIFNALPSSSRRTLRASSLECVSVSGAARRVLLDAFMRDCIMSQNFGDFRESRSKIRTRHHRETASAEATDRSNHHGRHSKVLKRPSSGSPKSVSSNNGSEKIYDVDDLLRLTQELLSTRPISRANRNESIEKAERAASEGSSIEAEPSLSRRLSPREVNSEMPGACDENRSGIVTPTNSRSVFVGENPTSEVESPHNRVAMNQRDRVPNWSLSRRSSPKRVDSETRRTSDGIRPDFITPPNRRSAVFEENPTSEIESPHNRDVIIQSDRVLKKSPPRKSSLRRVHSETRGPCDELRPGSVNPPNRRSVIAEEIPTSEVESLHIPVVITEGDGASKQQSVEVQVRDRNVNRERVSSSFELVNWGPPIPEIAMDDIRNTRLDRFETITTEDVRRARLLGQLDRSFLVLSKDTDGNNLLLIDQHALHERILLDQLEDECFLNTDRPTPTCILAPAVSIKVREDAQIRLIERDISMMERHGFLVKPVHNEVILIQTAPRCLSTSDAERIRGITSLIFNEFKKGSEAFSAIFHRVLKSRACRNAIKCPQELSRETQERLVREMLQCRLPFQCCHGRPSIHPILSNVPEIFTVNRAHQSALWETIKSNIEKEKMDREGEETPPNTP